MENICQRLDIGFIRVREYLSTTKPIQKLHAGNKERGLIAQWEILKLSEALGIKVKATIMLLPFEESLINKIKIAQQDATF